MNRVAFNAEDETFHKIKDQRLKTKEKSNSTGKSGSDEWCLEIIEHEATIKTASETLPVETIFEIAVHILFEPAS